MQGACSLPHFCSLPRRSGSCGFLVFLYVFMSVICPTCTGRQLFSVPHCFFVFCFWRRPSSRCRACSKGPRPPPVLLRVKTQSLPCPPTHTQQRPTGPQPQAPCRIPCQPHPPRLDWPERPSSWLSSELSATWNKWKLSVTWRRGRRGFFQASTPDCLAVFRCGYTQLGVLDHTEYLVLFLCW